MSDFALIPAQAIRAVADGGGSPDERLALVADMCRLNALTAVKRAGSGHLGSTFSALDLVSHLLFETLDVRDVGFASPNRDVFFSSKGHDVPGLYAVLHALGVIPSERLLRLRRYGGLDGHPDVGVPGIEANSGSLGMGLSKGRGIALAKRLLGREGVVVVLTGDGELQEGQNWEAFQAAAHQGVGRLWAIVDRNELQSDKPTEEILALGDLEQKLRAFGWHVERCDGHDHAALRRVFSSFRALSGHVPKALVADTVKGKGVSFMEHPAALAAGGGVYRWHAGAPDDDAYTRARVELLERIEEGLAALGAPGLELETAPEAGEREPSASLQGEPESGAGSRRLREDAEFVVAAFGEEALRLALEHEHVVVLDADLASDCRVRAVELERPDRFLENGIAEQDMVSAAAGLARHGLLPIVNSFASFLASRANEQIYNQASERSKVVYALHYAGLIPAGPGKSHQSIRDVSLLGALPNVAVVHPGNGAEAQALLRWAVEESDESVAIRLAIGPSPRALDLDGTITPGRGTLLHPGEDALLIAYGPVMLAEAMGAAERLSEEGVSLAVVAMPWLNRIDGEWAAELVERYPEVHVLEDHAPVGALGDALLRALQPSGALEGRPLRVLGVEGWPACGTPAEALAHHGLDAASLAARIGAAVTARARR